jgi:hypothetical protein
MRRFLLGVLPDPQQHRPHAHSSPFDSGVICVNERHTVPLLWLRLPEKQHGHHMECQDTDVGVDAGVFFLGDASMDVAVRLCIVNAPLCRRAQRVFVPHFGGQVYGCMTETPGYKLHQHDWIK